MTKAEEVLDALLDGCRFGARGQCARHGCNVLMPGGMSQPTSWKCPVSGETMSTSRQRRRARREEAKHKQLAALGG